MTPSGLPHQCHLSNPFAIKSDCPHEVQPWLPLEYSHFHSNYHTLQKDKELVCYIQIPYSPWKDCVPPTLLYSWTVWTYCNQLTLIICLPGLNSLPDSAYCAEVSPLLEEKHAHSNQPGPLTSANAQAFVLASSLLMLSFQAPQNSHELHQQSAKSLQVQFSTLWASWTDHYRACPSCSSCTQQPSASAINPQGLKSDAIWQTWYYAYPRIWMLKACSCNSRFFFSYNCCFCSQG